MVEITNGLSTMTVTKGAFDGIYKHQGYTLVHDYAVAGATMAAKRPVGISDSNYTPDDRGLFTADLEAPDEMSMDDEDSELLEKPIGQWSQEELKRYADKNGISLEGVTKTREVRGIIKDFIDSQK